MVVFDAKTGFLTPKDLGRIASSFYISTQSIETFNIHMKPRMTEADVLKMLSLSSEFENIKVRDEEVMELKKLEKSSCACDVDTFDTFSGKANILLQSYISRSNIDDFALISDTAYVSKNASRILRALFQIALSRSWGPTASVILTLSKGVDKKMWSFETPLRQFDLPYEILDKVENLPQSSIEGLKDISEIELGELIRNKKMGPVINRCLNSFPLLHLDAQVSPITRTVLRIQLSISISTYYKLIS
jgi:replicative superfamily II helicase